MRLMTKNSLFEIIKEFEKRGSIAVFYALRIRVPFSFSRRA